jgi:hypothetical protein
MDFVSEIYTKHASSPCGYCASSYKNESDLRTEFLALYALPVSTVEVDQQNAGAWLDLNRALPLFLI